MASPDAPVPGEGQAHSERIPLWAPRYGASPSVAVARFWQKYARFDGRAGRSEYWWWQLAQLIVYAVLGTIAGIGGSIGATVTSDGRLLPGGGVIVGVLLLSAWWLATIVPNLALLARRLHDVNLSAWLMLIGLVPYLGGIAVLVITLLSPNPYGARFDRPDDEVPGYQPVVPVAAGYRPAGFAPPPQQFPSAPYPGRPFPGSPYGSEPEPGRAQVYPPRPPDAPPRPPDAPPSPPPPPPPAPPRPGPRE